RSLPSFPTRRSSDLYVEDSARDLYDPEENDFTSDPTANISAVAPFLESHGFKDKWCFRSHALNRCFCLSESQLNELYRDADAFLDRKSTRLNSSHVA